jgi:hypothetical protein
VRPWVRWLVVAAAVAGVAVLFVALQPDAAEDGPSPSPSTPSPTATPSGSPSPTPSESPEPERTVIDVAFRNGSVRGPTRFTVIQGERVRILVRADVSDHIHLHGYDLLADVASGEPARIDFVADAAGVFEVELEDAGTLLFNLEVAIP